MNVLELYSIVVDHFNYKATGPYLNREEKEVTCTLYESFIFRCNVGGRYGTFGGKILMTDGNHITTFFGKSLSLNSDQASIINNLEIVDNFCRLKLPDKFLAAYDEAYKN